MEWVHKGIRGVLNQVADKRDITVRLVTDRPAADQVVGDDEAVISIDQAQQASHATLRIVDGVVHDLTVTRVGRDDARLGRAGDEVVAHDAARAMDLDPVGAVRVAQLHTHVAIDDHVALDEAIAGVEPEEDRTASFAGAALNPDEDVIADDPVLRVHHVDARDVIAVGDVVRVVAELLGPVVVEQAVLNAAALGPDRRAILGRDLDALNAPLPDIVNDAVVDRQVLDVRLGVDLEAVPLDVLNRQVGHRHAGAGAKAEQLAVAAFGTINDHSLAVA